MTWPARFGWGVGFVAGLTADVALLPATIPAYNWLNESEKSFAFYLLAPSLVTAQAGIILFGTPFDALEFVLYRWWSGGEEEKGGDTEKSIEEDLWPETEKAPEAKKRG